MKEVHFYHSYWCYYWYAIALAIGFVMFVVPIYHPEIKNEVLVSGLVLLALVIIVFPGRAMVERKNGTPVITLAEDKIIYATYHKKHLFLFSELRDLSSYEIKKTGRKGGESTEVSHTNIVLTYREDILPTKMAEATKSECRRIKRTYRHLGAHCMIDLDDLSRRSEYIASLAVDYYKKYEKTLNEQNQKS